MKRIVRYNAIDPYYSTFEETYIGTTLDEVDMQQQETEAFIGRNHPSGIMSIYKTELIFEG